MNRFLASVASLALVFAAGSTFAADEYNEVPAGNAQFKQCKAYAVKLGWEGGNEKSPIKGQTKVDAFCTCMWNETPEDFKGNLATFSESARGKKMNKTCEKYADWHS